MEGVVAWVSVGVVVSAGSPVARTGIPSPVRWCGRVAWLMPGAPSLVSVSPRWLECWCPSAGGVVGRSVVVLPCALACGVLPFLVVCGCRVWRRGV